MATAGGTSSSKKNKKKRHSAPVVSSPNTITYSQPQPAAYPTMLVQQPGYPMQPVQPGFYAPGGYPIQPPGVYPAQVPGGGVPQMMVPATTPMMPPPQRLPQQMPQQQQQHVPPTQRQLDFDQAMSDFKGMFPNMDREVIETVLRSNGGKVDETIDQLLKLNADMPAGAPPPVMPPSTGMPLPPSQLPQGMFMSESFPDQPPPYSPPEPDSPFSRFNSNSSAHSNTPTPATSAPPVPVARNSREATTRPRTPPPRPAPRRTRSVGGEESVSSSARESYRSVMERMGELQTSRQWNPPMIGNLPSDFLRLSVSGDQPASSPSPPTPASQTRVAPGIQQRLDENSNRRRSAGHNNTESNQMLEDEKLALMLQNDEFLRQLQQDPEFLSALERDYHESLRDGRTTSNPTPTTATSPGPPISSPPPRPSQPPLHRQPPPNMATRPLPATPTPGPELPARPPGMKRVSSGSSLPSSGAGGGGGRAGMTNGTPSASGGLSVEDIEFRNKLNHMGKSSKTTLSLLAGRFQKKKKASRKYEAEEGGATDALLGGESLYEELNDNELSHQVCYRKSSKKRLSFGRHGSLLRYEDRDPNFFSR